MISLRITVFILMAAVFVASCSDDSGVITTKISGMQSSDQVNSGAVTSSPTAKPVATVSTLTAMTVSTATQVPTAPATMVPDNSVDDLAVGPKIYEAPAESRQDRLFIPISNLFVDFTVYKGVPETIYQEVSQAILTAANTLPLPAGIFRDPGHLFVAIWHREMTNFEAVVTHRCEYTPSPSPETCQNELMVPMNAQSQGIALLARSPARFEIVWPTLDQHDFMPTSYWIPASHEWVHLFQLAHTINKGEVDKSLADVPLTGPIWLHEGTADYLGALIGDKHGGVNFGEVMSEYIRSSHDAFVSSDLDPELILRSCESPADQVNAELRGDFWQCPSGRVAMAYLMYKIGATTINEVKAFYLDLDQYTWSESFTRNYGRSPDQFYKEFADFMEMSFELKLAFISQPDISQ
ncbi:MAG TPA: hypothetical protein EYQ00_01470 [Dehalococcoidia bacterium]|nr:hypothetical protein [Dehalococcoidia bacterium]